ncbi:MAG: hypothetical protein KKE79_01380, partial [Actinobacteria bacterium]|nr:hypothetical protein [Actinomycetota bacterium]
VVDEAPEAAAADVEEEEEEEGEEEAGLGLAGPLRVGGKRGAGTSLVVLESFELEQELIELAGVAKKKKRRPVEEKDKKPTEDKKPRKGKKGKGGGSGTRGGKEVDKRSVKKIINDLKNT